MENNPKNQLDQQFSDTVSLNYILSVIIKQKALFSFIIALSVLSMSIYCLLADNIFRSEITFIEAETISSPESSPLGNTLGTFSSLTGIDMEKSSRAEEVAISTLYSKKFLYEFIKKNELIVSEIKPKVFLNEKREWKSNQTLLEDIYRKFEKLINLDTEKKSNIHTLSVSWKNPKEGAYLANALIKDLNEHVRQIAIERIKKRIAFLQIEQSSSTLVNNKIVFSKLIESQINQNMMANTQKEFVFEVIDPAIDTNYHFSPQRLNLMLISFFVGLFAGFIIAHVREYFQNNRINKFN